jgi:nicotinamidase-related amidase
MDEYTRPDYKSIALVTIDAQNDFSLPGAPLEIKGTMEVIPNIVKLLELFRKLAKPIIHVVRLYKEDGSNVDMVRRKRIEDGVSAVRPGSDGAELVRQLKPHEFRLDSGKLLEGFIQRLTPDEFVIYKPRWGAFYATALGEFLREKGINTLAFTGCNFPNCPRTSIYQASERDFRVVVVKDAISGIHGKGVEELANIGCEISVTQELADKLQSS